MVAADVVELLGAALMAWSAPNRAPEGCRAPRCVHLDERVCTLGGVSSPVDRCVEGRPMHEACPWHETAEEARLKSERDAALLLAARAPFVSRGPR